jgi:hypothetical protein
MSGSARQFVTLISNPNEDARRLYDHDLKRLSVISQKLPLDASCMLKLFSRRGIFVTFLQQVNQLGGPAEQGMCPA